MQVYSDELYHYGIRGMKWKRNRKHLKPDYNTLIRTRNTNENFKPIEGTMQSIPNSDTLNERIHQQEVYSMSTNANEPSKLKKYEVHKLISSSYKSTINSFKLATVNSGKKKVSESMNKKIRG